MLERMFVALLYHIRYNFAKLPNKLFRSNLRNDIMVDCVDQWRAPMKRPVIKTSLPGPAASKLINVDKTYVSPSYTRTYPLVVDQGNGLWVRDVDGNEFLDFTAGIAGRTGKMFAMEHFGVKPDIVALAKGIASGLPLGAILAKGKIMDWEEGSHASTFGGNPVSCVAAMATIELLEKGLVANAATQGKRLMKGLKKLQDAYECMGDVRGKGS